MLAYVIDGAIKAAVWSESMFYGAQRVLQPSAFVVGDDDIVDIAVINDGIVTVTSQSEIFIVSSNSSRVPAAAVKPEGFKVNRLSTSGACNWLRNRFNQSSGQNKWIFGWSTMAANDVSILISRDAGQTFEQHTFAAIEGRRVVVLEVLALMSNSHLLLLTEFINKTSGAPYRRLMSGTRRSYTRSTLCTTTDRWKCGRTVQTSVPTWARTSGFTTLRPRQAKFSSTATTCSTLPMAGTTCTSSSC